VTSAPEDSSQPAGRAIGPDARLLERSIELARRNVELGGHPFGAVISEGTRIIAEGTNLVLELKDPTAHAEIVAIRRACQELGARELTGLTIFASAEPCPMCLSAIYWSQLSRVVFAATRHAASAAGFDDAFLYGELTRPLGERSLPTAHEPHPSELEPFDLWCSRTPSLQDPGDPREPFELTPSARSSPALGRQNLKSNQEEVDADRKR
jgi:guanine deaminase